VVVFWQEPIVTDDEDIDRVLVVGDIHGCDVALAVLLRRLQLTSRDVLVILGDAVDRGPGSCRVLDQLVEVRKSSRLIFLMGNHEEMMLEALRGRRTNMWLRNGGAATLASYGGSLANIPDDHWQLLEESSPYWESSTDICVHANLEPGVSLTDQRPEWLRWQRLTGFEFPHPSGKRVLCGHSGCSTSLPAILDGWICLDTLAYEGGFLTCLDAGTGEISQAQQSGIFRGGVFLSEMEA
jgi:serine/threonine protein phosphatase 1